MKKVENKQNKGYTEAELVYLESSWGNVKVQKIAGVMGRTVVGIESKARKLNLGNPLDCKDFLIATEVVTLLGVDRKTLKKHLDKRGLKHKTRTLKNRKLIAINYDDLLEWLVEYPCYWDATKADKIGLLSLGMDANFFESKMKKDSEKKSKTTLTEKDIEKIKEMYKDFYTYKDIADKLGKSYETVKWKLHTLLETGELEANTFKNRLVRTTNRENYGWTKSQDMTLLNEFRNGKTLKEISVMVGKSLSATKSRNQMLAKRQMKGLTV